MNWAASSFLQTAAGGSDDGGGRDEVDDEVAVAISADIFNAR